MNIGDVLGNDDERSVDDDDDDDGGGGDKEGGGGVSMMCRGGDGACGKEERMDGSNDDSECILSRLPRFESVAQTSMRE